MCLFNEQELGLKENSALDVQASAAKRLFNGFDSTLKLAAYVQLNHADSRTKV